MGRLCHVRPVGKKREGQVTKEKDFVRSAITAHLAPVLAEAGFSRYRPKHFIRIRGELVDCISFQMSVYGSKAFYVHYYVNLLSDPAMNINSYRLGNRVHAAPREDGVPWEGATEEAATAALQSVAVAAQELMLPWLSSIAGPRDYVYEYVANPNTTLESLQLAIALLLTGTTNRPWWICESLKSPKFYDSPPEEFEKQQMQWSRELQPLVNGRTYSALLGAWKSKNLEAFGLNRVKA